MKVRFGKAVVFLIAASGCAISACGNASSSAKGKANGGGADAGSPAAGGRAVVATSGSGSGFAGAGAATSNAGSDGGAPGGSGGATLEFGGANGGADPSLPVQSASYWRIGGGRNDGAGSVELDASENVYVAGDTMSALNGPLVDYSDVFVRKFDAQGNVLWTLQWGSAHYNYYDAMAVEASGNFYVSYRSSDSNDRQRSVAHLNKYDPSGTLLWAQDSVSMSTSAIEVASNNDIYVLGSTLGGPTSASYLRKYDSSGVAQWTTQFDAGTYATDLAVDAAGLSYVAGATKAGDGELYKFDAAGAKLWTQHAASAHYEGLRSVALDPAGNVFVAGTNQEVDPSGSLIRKYDPSGNISWTREFGNPLRFVVVPSMTVDLLGNAYVVGYAEGPIDGLTPNTGYVGFIRKYDPNGVVQWTHECSVGEGSLVSSVAVAANGNVYGAGVVYDPPVNSDEDDENALLVKLDVH